MLREKGFYAHRVDNDAGAWTKKAVLALQHSCDLPTTGKLDAKTKRVMVMVFAEKQLVAMPGRDQ